MMKISNILFVISLVFTIAGCGGAEDRKAAYLEKAEKSLNAGDLEKARIELKNVLQIDPKDARAYFKLGEIFERQKEFRRSFGNYNKAAELDPDNLEYQAKLGRFHLLLAGDIETATEKMNLILSKDKNNINGLLLKAGILSKQGKIKEAKEIAANLFKNHPNNVENAIFLSSLYLQEKEYDDAIRVLDNAVISSPGDQSLLAKLADVLFVNKDFSRSEQTLKEILNAHPDVFQSHLMLALFYQKTGEAEKAEAVLRDAIAADEENVKRKLVLVEFFQQTKGNDEAIKELESLIKNNPKESSLRLALARMQLIVNNIDGATATYKAAVKDFSDEEAGITSRVQLAKIYMQKKNVESAKFIIAEASEIVPNDAEVNLIKAKIALVSKDTEQAIISLRSVVKDNPDNLEAYLLLASSHRMNNEERQAKDIITRAYENNRDNIKVLLPLAKYHLQNKNISDAENIIDNYLRLDAENYEALSIKSNILNANKNYTEAYMLTEKMINKYPDKENGYIQSIPTLLANNDIDKAIDLLTEGYTKSNAIKLLKLKAELQISAGKTDDAIASLTLVGEKDKDESIHKLLAKAYLANKDIKSAKKVLEDSIAQDKMRAQSYLLLANVYFSEKNTQQAMSVLQDGVNVNPGDVQLAVILAGLHERKGDVESAIKLYETVLLNNADNLVATNNLAILLSENRADPKSLDRAIELAGKMKEVKQPNILDTVGWVYFKAGNYADAAVVLKKVIESEPDNAIFNYHLGMAYYKNNDNESARKYLSKSLSIEGDFKGRSEAEKLLNKL